MPVGLQLVGVRPRRIPVIGDPFRIGRGAQADLVIEDAHGRAGSPVQILASRT